MEYTNLMDQHLRAGQGFLLCFAVDDAASFAEAKTLHQTIVRVKDPKETIAFALAATKIVPHFMFPPHATSFKKFNSVWCLASFEMQDVRGPHAVGADEAKTFADRINAPYVETSAKVRLLLLLLHAYAHSLSCGCIRR